MNINVNNNHDLIRAIYQCVTDCFHGSDKENYLNLDEPIRLGLKREVGELSSSTYPLMGTDGFHVKIFSNGKMRLLYSRELHIREITPSFHNDIEYTIQKIMEYIQKSYEAKTGEKLRVEPIGEAKIDVESVSMVRSWITAQKFYFLSDYKSGDEIPEHDQRIKKHVDSQKGSKFV